MLKQTPESQRRRSALLSEEQLKILRQTDRERNRIRRQTDRESAFTVSEEQRQNESVKKKIEEGIQLKINNRITK